MPCTRSSFASHSMWNQVNQPNRFECIQPIGLRDCRAETNSIRSKTFPPVIIDSTNHITTPTATNSRSTLSQVIRPIFQSKSWKNYFKYLDSNSNFKSAISTSLVNQPKCITTTNFIHQHHNHRLCPSSDQFGLCQFGCSASILLSS